MVAEPVERSWNEVQSKAARAAIGAGVPHAQALAFGTMVARLLADGGAATDVAGCLDDPARIVALAGAVEEAVEAASVTDDVVRVPVGTKERDVLAAWLRSLPCQAELAEVPDALLVKLELRAPNALARPVRVSVGCALWQVMEDLAARTYVPDSDASRQMGAGAGLMDLD
ncbi:MAG: hypothetical protein AAGL96_00710 [Pseudomonadota bacterium]